eukprot:4343338-Alexandrium_andersonii.AAC.1
MRSAFGAEAGAGAQRLQPGRRAPPLTQAQLQRQQIDQRDQAPSMSTSTPALPAPLTPAGSGTSRRRTSTTP